MIKQLAITQHGLLLDKESPRQPKAKQLNPTVVYLLIVQKTKKNLEKRKDRKQVSGAEPESIKMDGGSLFVMRCFLAMLLRDSLLAIPPSRQDNLSILV
jgi:hypothetical protein